MNVFENQILLRAVLIAAAGGALDGACCNRR